jgi:hypothetical protein
MTPFLLPLTVLLAASLAAGESTPQRMIGFRADTSGLFPTDAAPPIDFDGPSGRNLVWKVPLANFSNSSCITVGRQVFVITDVGWPAGEGDTPILWSYAADDGKELWHRPIDPLTTLPEGEAASLRKLRSAYFDRVRKAGAWSYRYRMAPTGERAAIQAQAAAELGEAAAAQLPKIFASWKPGDHLDMLRQGPNKFTDTKPELDALRKAGVLRTWCWNWTGMGTTMAPPVSDGRRVYVYTGNKTVSAFNLDGTPAWQVFEQKAGWDGHGEEDLANAPVLVDGLLVLHWLGHLWAYQTADGRLAWKTPTQPMWYHGCGTPQVLRLPDAGGAPVTAIATRNGYLIRASDGAVLCKGVGMTSAACLVTNGADVLYTRQGGVGGHYKPPADHILTELGSQAVRFVLKGDTATPERIWHQPKLELGNYPFYRDGSLIIESLATLDAGTGAERSPRPTTKVSTYHSWILAGGHFFGIPKMQDMDGKNAAPAGNDQDENAGSKAGSAGSKRIACWVVQDGAPAKALGLRTIEILDSDPQDKDEHAQRIALTSLAGPAEWYGWHSAYVAPFASGNRLFIRTFDYLYCFGDKAQPFTPSKAFAAAP